MMNVTRHRCRCAFTLMEVLIAMALLGLAVTAVTQAVTAGQMQMHEALHRARAVMLAEAMIEEVLSKPYGNPDQGLGSTAERDAFSEIGHYHGFEEAPGEVSDQAGAEYPAAYQVFTRTVNIETNSSVTNPFSSNGLNPGLLVTVTVKDDRRGEWTVERFVPEPAE